MTRRLLLASCLPLGAAAAAGDRFRVATSGFMWQKDIEQGIRTTGEMGFAGIEPFRTHLIEWLPRPNELKARLDAAGISLVSCSNGGPGQTVNFIDPSKVSETISSHYQFAKDFLSKFTCKHFKINLGARPSGGPTDAQLVTMAETLNELGRRIADLGLKLAPHPHIWSPLERSHELNRVMQLTDPRYVGMVADTAHLTLGGMDPERVLRKYSGRVTALHFKDTPPRFRGHRGPTPAKALHRKENLYKDLGAGGVDFPAIIAFLRNRRFDGWITLDLDPPREGDPTIKQRLEINKRYLREKLDHPIESRKKRKRANTRLQQQAQYSTRQDLILNT